MSFLGGLRLEGDSGPSSGAGWVRDSEIKERVLIQGKERQAQVGQWKSAIWNPVGRLPRIEASERLSAGGFEAIFLLMAEADLPGLLAELARFGRIRRIALF